MGYICVSLFVLFSSSDSEDRSSQRVRTTMTTRRDIVKPPTKRGTNLLDLLSDDLLIEVFKHLPHFPHLLRAREVCKRWQQVACSPRLWTSLSFEGHEHVASMSLNSLCKTLSFRKLRKLSLAKVHGVDELCLRMIPRTECAATLESVDLSWCSGASDRSVVEFSRCPGLKELRLSHCRSVTRRSVRILAVRCPRLEVLDMNCISGLRDSLLSFIGQNCPYLRVLNIANGKSISDDGIDHIARGCPRLEVLDLSWCVRVTDSAVSSIAANVPGLREIGLSETRVSNDGIKDLTRFCSKLEAVYLARCGSISDPAVESIISNCGPRLKSLNLASCQNVTDTCVEKLITECPQLNCLDVSKLPCRPISEMLKWLTAERDIEVYF